MKYQEWEENVPNEFKGDPLWKTEVYRLALLLSDLAWHDASKLMKDKRTQSLSDQLYRAVGSVSANIAEGYSQGTGKNRARYYQYALGSARESRGWYYTGRHILGFEVAQHRMQLLTKVIRLLMTMIPDQRGRKISDDHIQYNLAPDNDAFDLQSLLVDIPTPKMDE